MPGLLDTPGNSFIGLSVVMIARNEAQNIARAIESVLRAVRHWPQTEILLVDSASTDETVEIAKQYPISIVRLHSSWFLSAAAGRYIGTCYTKGDMILFLDGDMELDSEWLDLSIPYALEHPQAAGISGFRRDVYTSNGQIEDEVDCERDLQSRTLDVKFISGAMLCQRSALQKVGGFYPFIKSEEEIDLSMRLRHAGYRLVRLPFLICRHYCIPMNSVAGSLRRHRLDLWLGYGQVPRYYLGTPLFWTYLFERGTFVIPLIGMFLFLATLFLTLFSRNIAFFGSWVLISIAVILAFSVKKHSLRKALLSCLIRTMISYSTIRGFLMVPRSQAEYPTDAEIVKICNQGENSSVDTPPTERILQNSIKL
jgi:glycosyltransferase involved in cell wall biosynthesis